MAALIDSSVKAFSVANGTDLSTGSLTVAGSNRVLYVFVGSGAGSAIEPIAVKWGGSGGTSLTKIATRTLSGNAVHTLWRLIAPAATSSTVYVDWGTNQDEQFIIAVSVKDADQATPNGTVATANGSGTGPTVGAASVAGDLVLDGVYFLDLNGSARTLAEGAGQTELQELRDASHPYEGMAASHETAAGTTTTMSWTISGSVDFWSAFAFAVNAATGGGGGGGAAAAAHHYYQMIGVQ